MGLCDGERVIYGSTGVVRYFMFRMPFMSHICVPVHYNIKLRVASNDASQCSAHAYILYVVCADN